MWPLKKKKGKIEKALKEFGGDVAEAGAEAAGFGSKGQASARKYGEKLGGKVGRKLDRSIEKKQRKREKRRRKRK